MRRVSAEVDLGSLGVNVRDAKRSKVRGVTLMIKTIKEADRLAGRLKEVIGSAASVKRPTITAALLLLDVPYWVEAGVVKADLATVDVQVALTVLIVVTKSDDGRAGTTNVVLLIAAAIYLGKWGHVRVSMSRCMSRLFC